MILRVHKFCENLKCHYQKCYAIFLKNSISCTVFSPLLNFEYVQYNFNKEKNMQISKWLFVILASSLLVACGGDDGDSSSSTTTNSTDSTPTTDNSPNPGTTITSQNSAAFAGSAFKRLFDTLGAGNTLSNTSTGMGAGLVGGVDIDGGFNLADYAKRQMERVENSGISATSTVATGVIITDTLSCDDSGTNDIIWADNDDDEDLSVGDTFTITAHNCVEDGETTNGQISFSLLGDESNLSMTFVFTNFTTVDFEGTSTFDGDLSMSIQENEANSFESVSISSNVLNFSDPESAGTFSNFSLTVTTTGTLESLLMTADALTFVEEGVTETLSNFSLTFTEDSNTLLSTMALNGTFNDPELGGVVSIDTPQPFEELASNDFPYAGIMKIIASDNSSVTLTVLDAVNVRLDVDEDGDGAIDETSDMTWTSLDT